MSDNKKPVLISRRHFLRTSSGLVAIPLLTSLLPRELLAQMTPPKRFLGITTNNGYHPAFMYPEFQRIMTNKVTSNGLDAHIMPLSNLSGSISHIIGPQFDSLKSSMMVLRGFEAMAPTFDHNGVFDYSGMIPADLPPVGSRYPSIDQHIKNVVYGASLPGVPILSMCASWDGRRASKSFTISPTGNLVYTPNFFEPSAVWQQLFGNYVVQGAGDLTKNRLVGDKVLEHFQAVVTNPKLSKDDKIKLEDHLTLVSDRQKTIQPPGGTCIVPPTPTVVFQQQAATVREAMDAFNDLIVAAFNCDITRIAMLEIDPDVLWGNLDPHRIGYHAVSHGVSTAEMLSLSNIAREQFSYIGSLWQKLQAQQDIDGNSLFYNTLSLVTKELGDYGQGVRVGNPAIDRTQYAGTMATAVADNNHLGRGKFAMIGGNLGGILKPGKYIDYTCDTYSPNGRWKPLIGPSYSELLVSVLAAFGVAPNAWELNGARGYGDNRTSLYGSTNPSISPKSNDQRSMLPGWAT